MDFLDQLLADAAAEVARRVKAKPKAAHAVPAPELFQPSRLVAMFYRSACAHCGTVSLEFEGLFEERRHIRTGDTHSVRQPFIPLEAGLPRVRKHLPRDVPYCAACTDLASYEEE